jgi:uncharacterized protein YecE (DUF72 family)
MSQSRSLPNNLYIGPSGWSYAHGNNVVYPASKSRSFHSLEFLSEYFDAIEINTTFYQSIRPEIARLWVQKVRDNPKFLFTAKLNRRFTHDRILNAKDVSLFKEGIQPIKKAGKLGCLLMQFPWSFRFTEENKRYLIEVRRAFHDYPLVAEMRHSSWMVEEALGTFIDYRIGFCNIDQATYTKAMPPTSYLTSAVGYVRLHGRNPRDWDQEFGRVDKPMAQHDYLYSIAELTDWQARIDRISENAGRTFVFANNDAGAKSVVNALQLARLCGDDRRCAPAALIQKYRLELADYAADNPAQSALFNAFTPSRRVA